MTTANFHEIEYQLIHLLLKPVGNDAQPMEG